MEFCGRCGKDFDRSLERGRFCAACGHENPGNARYPLYAAGAAAGTAPGVTVGSAAGGSAPGGSAAGAATAVAMPRIADPDVTSVRMSPVPAMAPAAPIATPVERHVSAEPVSAWRTAVISSLGAMLVVVLLGAFLLFH